MSNNDLPTGSIAIPLAAVLSGLAYLPIREATSDLKASVNLLAGKMVRQRELDWHRVAEDRARTDANAKDLRDAHVPRQELDFVFGSMTSASLIADRPHGAPAAFSGTE